MSSKVIFNMSSKVIFQIFISVQHQNDEDSAISIVSFSENDVLIRTSFSI